MRTPCGASMPRGIRAGPTARRSGSTLTRRCSWNRRGASPASPASRWACSPAPSCFTGRTSSWSPSPAGAGSGTRSIRHGSIAALGTIVSAYAAYQSGQQQAKALDYQAKVARNQATAAQQAAQVAAENARERNRRVLASQRARIGASGVIGSEGSSLLVQLESAEQAALEEARIRYGGEVQATGLESAERLRRFEAGASRRAGTLGAGASLLQGAGTVYGIYRGAQTPPSTKAPYTTTGGT